LGGYVYLNPKYAEKVLTGVTSFDKNSMYPDKMRNYDLPFGIPKYFKGKYKTDSAMPYYVQSISCIFKLKAGYVPTIQLKKCGFFKFAQYATDSNNEIVNLVLTNFDLDLFLKHYDVYDLKYNDGYKFTVTNTMFYKYVDYYYTIKSNETGAKKTLAKLMLNSLYGKFGKRLRLARKIPYYDKIDKIVKYKTTEPEINEGLYLPVAVFITALARYDLINAIQQNYDNFVYCDTDSIHLINSNPMGLEIDSKKLGAWKNEGTAEVSKYLHSKTYFKIKDGKKITTCCGMPKDCKKDVTLENFKSGMTFAGKLVLKRVEGGSLLSETTFTIK
jgi:hypothetical protein